MKVAIASDHAGFEYKEAIRDHLARLGHEVRDFGTDSSELVDYPDFVRPAAEAVARGEFDRRGPQLRRRAPQNPAKRWKPLPALSGNPDAVCPPEATPRPPTVKDNGQPSRMPETTQPIALPRHTLLARRPC